MEAGERRSYLTRRPSPLIFQPTLGPAPPSDGLLCFLLRSESLFRGGRHLGLACFKGFARNPASRSASSARPLGPWRRDRNKRPCRRTRRFVTRGARAHLRARGGRGVL